MNKKWTEVKEISVMALIEGLTLGCYRGNYYNEDRNGLIF
jgi:hypothetical protein